MLMTSILDYAPEPGEVVEFRLPDAAVETAADAPEHPAPPSYVQENHIWRRLANQAVGKAQSPWLATVFDLPGRLQPEAMAAALEKWIRRHSTLLTWFSQQEGKLQRHAVPEELLSLNAVSVGAHETPAAVREHLLDRFDAGTDPLRWPPFVAGAVLRDSSSTVYFAVDHAHTDGYSVLLVFHELRALYQAELAGVEAKLPEVGSYVDACALDRERAAEITAESPEVGRWLDFWLAGPPPAFPLDLGVEDGKSYPSVPIHLDLFDADEADAFSRVCKAHGAGFSAGLLAALGITAYELAGHESYRGLTVVHTRDEPRWQATQGWFINLAPVAFPVAGRASFSEVVGGAQHAFTEAQALAGVSLLRVAELMSGLTVQADPSAVPPMVSYLDCRHAPGSRDWDEADCQALVGPGDSRDVPIWVNRQWERTYLKTRHPDTEVARSTVPHFLNHLRQVLQDLARTGQYRIGERLTAANPA
ncbi:condensation domain-containing protein [Amycolatopsis anabasis]|uniref:condensation domain-containing protein n=1 Tax=Amycolatopsis anabasis TaxID=1840409 RepID=UPI00131B17F7|nr:condensation domain-containing protein [Amycolatopsis anabasis]